jgi:hypothetical protein
MKNDISLIVRRRIIEVVNKIDLSFFWKYKAERLKGIKSGSTWKLIKLMSHTGEKRQYMNTTIYALFLSSMSLAYANRGKIAMEIDKDWRISRVSPKGMIL